MVKNRLMVQRNTAPTPERYAKGAIERLDRPIIHDGTYEPPYVAVDLLGALLARGSITKKEVVAGHRFRAWFQLSQLDALQAADWSRPFVSGGKRVPELSVSSERARREIDKAIRWVGGVGSISGSCLWYVIGLDQSLRSWAVEQREATSRRVHQAAATGVLVVALETLARMPWKAPKK